MTAQEFYQPLYDALDTVTPLKKDCGVLCDGACCKDGEEPAGMLLFPFEEELFLHTDFATVIPSKCEYGATKTAKLLLCRGVCNRKQRPLACRIFPLLPYRHLGQPLRVITDPRARGMCPLVRSLQPNQLEPLFQKRVREIAVRILQLKDGAAYLDMLADLADQALFLK